MKILDTTIWILDLAGLGGLGIFIYYLCKGMKERIRIVAYYKQAFKDLQNMQRQVIYELKEANSKKDEQLAKLKKIIKSLKSNHRKNNLKQN